jgi:predicted RNA-binding Zn ribbon-like protein
VGFEFLADQLALDFVGTVSERGTTHEDKLRSGSDLGDWIAQAGLVQAAPAVTEPELHAAKALREALFRLVTALTAGQPPAADDLLLLNAAAAQPPPAVHLDASGRLRREGGLAACLSAVARSGVELLGGPDRELVRWCAGERCTRPFVDRSRGRRRRWCGMAGCGDRAKAAAYRERRRGRAQPGSSRP